MSSQHAGHGEGPHITPLPVYFAVFGALLVLTGVTVGIAQFDFGAANTLIAMIVAAVKATLVALFFMHLLHEERLNGLAFVFGLLFVALFFIFTLTDVYTRGYVDPQLDNLAQQHEQVRELELAAEKAAGRTYPKRTVGEDYPTDPSERVNPPKPVVKQAVVVDATPRPKFDADPAKVEAGKKLFTAKTCSACHSLDGSKLVGPSMQGIWGRPTKIGETMVTVDRAYFFESVKAPNAKIVSGYPPAMPPMPMTDDEIEAILHYVTTL
jgi:caa(3)-type oxidase subunit IV